MWAILSRIRYPADEYNKLGARKTGPCPSVREINDNANKLKLPSHIKTSDVFNAHHLIPYHGDSSSEDDANSRTSSLSLGGWGVMKSILKNAF